LCTRGRDRRPFKSDDAISTQLALNEVVLEKIDFGHTVRLATSIDGEDVFTYSADGVIIATATGSTAYNLSAGGPILSPALRAMVVTPVAPHLSLDRSLVLTDTQRVTVDDRPDRAAALVIDGQEIGRLEPGATVTCRCRRVRCGWCATTPRLRRAAAGPAPGRSRAVGPAAGRDADRSARARSRCDRGPVALLRGPDDGLTGETGAGKTLVVEALQLVLGGRANPTMVRAGATEALVEARFVRETPKGEREIVIAAPCRPRAAPGRGSTGGWRR
jgi:hypothetical protein